MRKRSKYQKAKIFLKYPFYLARYHFQTHGMSFSKHLVVLRDFPSIVQPPMPLWPKENDVSKS